MTPYSGHARYAAELIAALMLFSGACLPAETPQAHVHNTAHNVMPFDMSRTVHAFRMTETGGVQSVTAKDPGDSEQIALIRLHLLTAIHRWFGAQLSEHGADAKAK